MSIQNRYEIMFFVSCVNGTLNGDPDSDNDQRVDFETNIGLVSDCAIKRRVRDYVMMAYKDVPGMGIIMQPSIDLNRVIAETKESAGVAVSDESRDGVNTARAAACQKFFDVRTFGAVMSTGPNAGQVRGPVQFTFGRSLSPVTPTQMTITRVCDAIVTSKSDKAKMKTVDSYKDREMKVPLSELRSMGRKSFIPFGLFEVRGFISANLSDDTGFSEEDLKVLCEAIMNMYEHDHSASRGEIAVVSPVILFKHIGLTDPVTNAEDNARSAKLGCAPAHKLFELVSVKPKDGVEYPRSYRDYDASINFNGVPRGVEVGFYDGYDTTWGKLPDGETWFK